jgi:superfamily II DNA or RNA helicase
MLELRPYQEECVNCVVNAYKEGVSKYEVVVLPTGAGKTCIASVLIHELQKEHGINVLFIAHRDELLMQAIDKFRMVRPDMIIGKVGAGSCEYGGEVTVASIQTICRDKHIEKMQNIGYGLIIVDEAHHIQSPSYKKVLEALPDAFVLGVTATPERLDKKDILRGRKPLYEIDIRTMAKDGYLCNFRAIAIQTHINIDNVRKSMGDFNEVELDRAVNVPERNQLIVSKYKEYANEKRAACFCVSVEHAEMMSSAFSEADIASAVIKGSTPLEERARIYAAFKLGEVKVLCSVMVLTEGWDSPECECIIMARPTQSRGLYIQMCGRGLRLSPGKQECLMLDITDNCTKHKMYPQNLKRAIGMENMRNGEDMLSLLEREEKEEKEIQVRILKEKRLKDKPVDLFSRFNWSTNDSGVHIMEVGREKHKIALMPSKSDPNNFYVCAKLAHENGARQIWTDEPLPLPLARGEAERLAAIVLDDPNESTYLVDLNAEWRKRPASEAQLQLMYWQAIPASRGITAGQASKLIDAHKQSNKLAKQARKEARQAVGA